jgi:hypothetical protein
MDTFLAGRRRRCPFGFIAYSSAEPTDNNRRTVQGSQVAQVSGDRAFDGDMHGLAQHGTPENRAGRLAV